MRAISPLMRRPFGYSAERAVKDIAIAAMNTNGSTGLAVVAMVLAVLPSLARFGLALIATITEREVASS
jgi:hypothetical protein